jgi:MFS family permease
MNTAQMTLINEVDLSQRSSVKAVAVWGLAVIFYFYELMLLVSPSVMVDDLTLTFKTSAEQLGSLAAFYYYAYAMMQIPVGLLMDRFGPRILLTLAAAFCALGCVIFGFAPALWVAQAGRFVMGIGGSFAVVGCLKLASLWFPVNRFAFLTGIMVSVGMMGGVFGQEPIAKIVAIIGWRDTVLLGAVLGAILSVIIWFVVSNHPFKEAVTKPQNLPPFAQEIKTWLIFATVVVAFLFPFCVGHVLSTSIPFYQSLTLYGLFYVGWTLAMIFKRRFAHLKDEIRIPLALIGLGGATYLLMSAGVSIQEFAGFSLVLGFFARGLFAEKLPIPDGLYQVMKMPQAWIASLYAGLMFVPTTGFGQLWGVPYFIERFHVDKDIAAGMVSMIFYGWAVGGPLYGYISDKLRRRKLPMVFAAIFTLVIMTAILYAPVTATQMKVLMFLLGAFSSGFILAFSIVREINIPVLTGTAIGFINTLNNASGALAQPVVGRLLDQQSTGLMHADGSLMYTVAMYNNALLFLPVCILLAVIILPFIRETYCRPQTAPQDASAANDA